MYRFVLIESNQLNEYKEPLLEVLSGFLTIDSSSQQGNQMVLEYSDHSEVSFYDVAQTMIADLYMDIRIYESLVYSTKEACFEALSYIKILLKQISFHKYFYLNNTHLLKEFYLKLTPELKRFILHKYAEDNEMKKTVRLFLENNQNTTLAAQSLYIHRNTLMQRIEKFFQATMFDVRQFQDAFLIYHLI